MVSIKDIAEKAGVSVSTASKALNNRSDVSSSTRERVKKIADSMGYFPNPIAKRLSAKKKDLIGVLILHTDSLEIGGSIFIKILGEIGRGAARKGYDILLITPEEGVSYMEIARRRQVDGLIILGLTLEDENLEDLKKSKLPMVILDQGVEGKMCVSTDNQRGIEGVMELLEDKGHRDIAFAGYCSSSQVSIERYKGYCSHMKNKEKMVYESGFSYEEGKRIGEKIVKVRKKPTAIVCSTDMTALGIIKVLKENNIKVPEEISVTGFDNLLSGRISTPELTTVAQDTETISKVMFEGLIDLIEGKNKSSVVIEGKLIIRESAGGRDEK